MARVIVIRSNDGERVTRRIRELLEDPEDMLKKIGVVLTSESQRAFDEQEFDGEPWEGRYPNQEDPVVNVAGVARDLVTADVPKARRFDRRPAGIDTRNLWNSLVPDRSISTPSTFVVEVGSDVEYASTVHYGGTTEIPILPIVKTRIDRFIHSKAGAPYYWKLVGLTGEATVLETQVVPRPFLGITERAAKKIVSIVENGPFEVLGVAEEGGGEEVSVA